MAIQTSSHRLQAAAFGETLQFISENENPPDRFRWAGLVWAPGAALWPVVAGLGALPTEPSAAAACRAAGVAFQAGTIADHGEVAAFGATFALVALHARLGDLLGR